ncbi:DUF177 domain-containing protein [Telmatospirillum sp. J64-1]|uniref:YceD family protein n=1 Tax=Telmatospirillum sp. J64-1 TaxID=2502183 RepID=UPI00115F3471|nr:DUF177 domain-containing protein [Telmatospirillum sp. J64-1]
MTGPNEIQPEFSRPVAAERLPASGTVVELEANEEERAALARRFDLLSLDSLTATISLKPMGGSSLLRLRGTFRAEVVQACVVTLEPVPSTIEDEFEMTFAPEQQEERGDIEVFVDAEDPPDPIVNGKIDIGEAVAEHLSLALDPFPRAPGAEFPETAEQAGEEVEEKRNPFAALEALRKKER